MPKPLDPFSSSPMFDLRGRQSVRATFKLSQKAIDAIGLVSLHMGIKQKSLFDHIIEDTGALEDLVQTIRLRQFKKIPRRQKTFVMSRRTIDALSTISRTYDMPRDALVEYAVQKLESVIQHEKIRHAERKKLAAEVMAHFEKGEQVYRSVVKTLGKDDPFCRGKTTTLRMLTGYFKPTSGRISVKNLHIPKDTLRIKSLIGYLPESAPLYHNMLVYDYLVYVANLKGIIDPGKQMERFKTLVDLCGLSGIMDKPIATLSKGLKQRVGLAHAMMTDPEILVLDEPTSGLDPNQIAEIRDIIRNIGRKKTIILSTHILSEAEATCDRIVIINNGKVVADDTAASLKQKGMQDSFVRLTLKGPDLKAAQDLLKTIHPALDIRSKTPGEDTLVNLEIRSPENKDIRSEIFLAVKQTDWIILELAKESQTLENIFKKLTQKEA
ncbi:MAG: ABC transporter ATP-binding protein [Desulfobacteraceae bacterium]|nr:ABC transporter ATP-binding protein [Desulfobacteraceae bacterium]